MRIEVVGLSVGACNICPPHTKEKNIGCFWPRRKILGDSFIF